MQRGGRGFLRRIVFLCVRGWGSLGNRRQSRGGSRGSLRRLGLRIGVRGRLSSSPSVRLIPGGLCVAVGSWCGEAGWGSGYFWDSLDFLDEDLGAQVTFADFIFCGGGEGTIDGEFGSGRAEGIGGGSESDLVGAGVSVGILGEGESTKGETVFAHVDLDSVSAGGGYG